MRITFLLFLIPFFFNFSFGQNKAKIEKLLKFVKVEGGTFIIGDTIYDDEMLHEVKLSDFLMQKTEVTQELWEAVMDSNPSTHQVNRVKKTCPVTDVSWDACQEFIKKLNNITGKVYHLPTVAEWEYAARGGKLSKGYRYAGSDDLNEVGWNYNNSNYKIYSVGKKKANELGLYDMSGNVWEWCNDFCGLYKEDDVGNPMGPDFEQDGKHILRGGSYTNDSICCSVSFRYNIYSYYCGLDIGLRLVTYDNPKIEKLFEFIEVEGGKFMMGDYRMKDAKPHEVELSSFYIQKTEVTQEAWDAVMGSNPSNDKSNKDNPVNGVSWDDCQKFILKLNRLTGKKYRLPTEAEWEYAARGGKLSKGYRYSGSNRMEEVAWFTKNDSGRIHPVAQKQPNELGIYDMSGNVWEWCNDWYNNFDSTGTKNPIGPENGDNRVIRGRWYRNSNSYRLTIRSKKSLQDDYGLEDSNYNFGLRLVFVPE
jgi:formylglycine-generating enzyme required for sulfatase activity